VSEKKHAYKYTYTHAHTHAYTHTCEYIYRVRWGKRPLRGKRPPSRSSLITYLFIPVSWSGYLHHLLVLFCINNLVEASQGSGHVFFSSEHIPCKCSVLSVVGWTGIFLGIAYIMAIDRAYEDLRISCTTIQQLKYCCRWVKVDVHQHGVWGKRPTVLWGKKPSMGLFTLS